MKTLLERYDLVIALSDPRDADSREQLTYHHCNLNELLKEPELLTAYIKGVANRLHARLVQESSGQVERTGNSGYVTEKDLPRNTEWPITESFHNRLLELTEKEHAAA